jgi:hypothetical protein
MADARIKGQEIEILIVSKGKPLDTITDVRSFEMAAQMEILREGYLGEKTDRRDDVYRGVRMRMELHFENDDIFKLMRDVIDRARRREPGTKINIKATLNFPNGDRPRVLIQDVFFGEIPMAFGSRTDYGTVTLEAEAEDFAVLS